MELDWNYLGIIIAVIGVGIAISGSVVGLFLWSRAETSSDRRLFDAKLDSNRKELDAKLDSNRKETNDILKSIQEEIKDFHDQMKDFHGRLCKIEEDKIRILMKRQ